MREEEIKKMAREEMLDTIHNNLDSAIIFTYVRGLEDRIDKAIEDMEEIRYKNNIDDEYVIDSSILTYWINILEGEDKE